MPTVLSAVYLEIQFKLLGYCSSVFVGVAVLANLKVQ